MMKRFYYYCAFALSLFPLCVSAQEESDVRWEDISALHYAVNGGTDLNNALQQYLLFNEAALAENLELFEQLQVFNEEFMKLCMNTPQTQELDNAIAELRKLIKENPDQADVFQSQIKEIEGMRTKLAGIEEDKTGSFTYNPADLLHNLTQISVNKKAYSSYINLGNGLFAVKTGPCYGSVESMSGKGTETEDKYVFTWGVIDYRGNIVIADKYKISSDYRSDKDIIILQSKGKGGSVLYGAVGYDGRTRIPFVYDALADWDSANDALVFSKGGKLGLVSFDGKVLLPFDFQTLIMMPDAWKVSKDGKHYGILDDKTYKELAPLKYGVHWTMDDENHLYKLPRFDGKVDLYDTQYHYVRTE